MKFYNTQTFKYVIGIFILFILATVLNSYGDYMDKIEKSKIYLNDEGYEDARNYFVYEELIEDYQDSELIDWVWNKCKNVKDDYFYLNCINSKFNANFKYKKSPPITLLTSENWESDCEGATAYYLSLAKKRGLKAKPIHTEGHIFALVEIKKEKNNIYCILDQSLLECF